MSRVTVGGGDISYVLRVLLGVALLALSPAPVSSTPEGDSATQWVVLGFSTDWRSEIPAGEVRPLAASSEAFGAVGAEAYRQETNRFIRSRMTAKAADGSTPPELFGPGLLEERLAMYLRPGPNRCVRPTVELAPSISPPAEAAGFGAYVRGVTDGLGRVVELELLYARVPRATPELLTFFRDALRIAGANGGHEPLEFFGYVGVSPDGEASWALAGACELE